MQKQSPEVFYKKRYSQKFRKIHSKTPVSEFLRKHLCLKACNFIKKETLTQVFYCKFCEIFQIFFFTEHLRGTASVNETQYCFIQNDDERNNRHTKTKKTTYVNIFKLQKRSDCCLIARNMLWKSLCNCKSILKPNNF